MKDSKQHLFQSLLLSLTLGLAPFFPEPHLWGKLRWVFGGGEGMAMMDYLDLLMHGAPWLYFLYSLVAYIRSQNAKPDQT